MICHLSHIVKLLHELQESLRTENNYHWLKPIASSLRPSTRSLNLASLLSLVQIRWRESRSLWLQSLSISWSVAYDEQLSHPCNTLERYKRSLQFCPLSSCFSICAQRWVTWRCVYFLFERNIIQQDGHKKCGSTSREWILFPHCSVLVSSWTWTVARFIRTKAKLICQVVKLVSKPNIPIL